MSSLFWAATCPSSIPGSVLGKEKINIGGKLTVSATENKKIVEDFFH